MPLELYAAFVAASVVLIAIPGPNVGLIIANSVAHGTRQGLVSALGANAANAAMLTLTVLGLVSLLAASAGVLGVLRWGGALLLVGLGLRQWSAAAGAAPRPSAQATFWQAALISLTNPATFVFYAAFFPQFIDAARDPLPQLVLLAGTFLAIALALDCGYAVLAAALRATLFAGERGVLAQRIGAALLMLLGVAIALLLAGAQTR